MKHVTATFHPPSNRIYFHNGDYRPAVAGYQQSYNQETWSLDLAARMADPDNTSAGWRLEYPYEGFGGTTVQPKHPDFCGFQWDQSRGEFCMIPGQMLASNDCAPGETINNASDPCFIYNEVMTFNPSAPMAQRWTRPGVGIGPDYAETWMSVYDDLNDRYLRFGWNGGSGTRINVLDRKTWTWSSYGVGDGSWRISKEPLAVLNRVIYVGDGMKMRMAAYHMDSWTLEDCGPLPGAYIGIENYTYTVANPRHNALEFLNPNDGTLYVADANTRPLAWTAAANFQARMGVYDPVNDVSLWAGGVDAAASPTLKLFRNPLPVVGEPVPVPPPDPEPDPVPPPPPPPPSGTWADSIAPGHVENVSLNTMQDVDEGPQPAGSGNIVKSVAAWNGGIFAPLLGGPNGSLIFAGGGDADGWSTNAFAWSCDTQRWTRIKNRTTALTWNPSADPSFNGTYCEHGDGTPAAPHSYDGYEYLPPDAGGGPLGSLIRHVSHIMYTTRETRYSHRLELGATDAASRWIRASGNASGIPYSAQSMCAYDPDIKGLWGLPTSNSGTWTNRLYHLDPITGSRASASLGGDYLIAQNPCMRFWRGLDGQRRYLVFVSGIDPRNGSQRVGPYLIDLDNIGGGIIAPPVSGSWYWSQGAGLTWAQALGCFFAQPTWDVGGGAVYRIRPGATWDCQPEPMIGTLPPANTYGVSRGNWKRLHWHDGLRRLLMYPNAVDGVYAYRPGDV